jgi:maleate cis-trans isomerase
MPFSSWRGTVGIVRPTLRTGGFEDLIRMLPEGIGVIPLILNVRRGAIDEFKSAIPAYEEKVAELAAAGVDVINPAGAPPFMVLGYRKEQALLRKWQDKYGTRIFTSGTSHIDALHALKVRRFVGATYFRGNINRIYAKYFNDAGFKCLAMAGMDVDFDKVQELSSFEVYRFVKREFLAHRGAEAIYMLGPAWRTLDIVEMLEQDLGVPVVHAIPAQCWDIQRHLHVRQPVKGFGRLVAEMPQGPTMSVGDVRPKRAQAAQRQQ